MKTRRPPGAYLLGVDGPGVEIPGFVADWLERQTDLARRRVELRGVDPAVDAVLIAVRAVAMQWHGTGSRAASDMGTPLAERHADEQASDRRSCELLSVSAAADLIGITPRAVRRAITENRLSAELVGATYVVEQQAALDYAEQRKPA